MFSTYLDRLQQYTARLAILNAKRKTGVVRDQIATCKREITYNRNQLIALSK